MNNSLEYVGIECRTDCPRCGDSLIVNGPVLKTVCSKCQSTVSLSQSFWHYVFDDLPQSIRKMENKLSPRQVWTSSFKLTMSSGRLDPACPSCNTIYSNLQKHIDDGNTTVSCSNCNQQGTISIPEKWLKSIVRGITVLVNAEVSQPVEESDQPLIKPIVFTCPSCTGALKVDGTQRVVDCNFCNSSIYLPDDLWLRMHPVKTVELWYAGFKMR